MADSHGKPKPMAGLKKIVKVSKAPFESLGEGKLENHCGPAYSD
jgi:hypothetical protein